jgi:hypothetical protein
VLKHLCRFRLFNWSSVVSVQKFSNSFASRRNADGRRILQGTGLQCVVPH